MEEREVEEEEGQGERRKEGGEGSRGRKLKGFQWRLDVHARTQPCPGAGVYLTKHGVVMATGAC